MSKKSEKIIGIDLGSYNSSVSVYEGNEVKVIANSEGGYSTPSVVAFTQDGIKVGESARRQAATNPEKTIFNIKRLMGKSYEQVKDLKRPYKIVDDNGRASVQIDDKKYSPEEISAMILQKMKKTAEDFLGHEVTKAIITVPAHFNSDERRSTQVSGEIAGLEVLRVISEPTAAVLNVDSKSEKKYLVVDFGGQTTDCSVVDVADGVFEILATDGDLDLGGSVIDEKIVDYLISEFKQKEGVDLRTDSMALQRLFEASEKAKIELSNSTKADINIPYITATNEGPKHLTIEITKSKFNQMISDVVKRVTDKAKSSLNTSGLKSSDIDEILLVGGSCRIPLVQEELEKIFGKTPNKSLNFDTAISTGATIQGGVLSGDNTDILLLDCLGISLGIETMGNVMTKMIESNTTIPARKTQIFSTSADNQPSVEIKALQGERPMSKDNKQIGVFSLEVPPAPRGIPQIEITYDLDANGILNITAEDKATGKKNNITISGSTKLSDEEIERMKREAEANAEADKLEVEKINKLNEADSMIFNTEKQIKEFDEKLTESEKNMLNEKLTYLKDAYSTKDLDKVNPALEELNTSWTEISTRIYSEQQQNPDVSQETNESDKVQDVDFEEVK